MTNVDRNIEIVQGIYAAFGRGDIPSILSHLDENIDWEPGHEHNRDIPWLTPGRGHQPALAFFEALRVFDFKRFEIVAITSGGPWVIALAALELVHRPSGRVLIESCEPHLWKLNANGKVVSLRHAADTRQHARVAGVSG